MAIYNEDTQILYHNTYFNDFVTELEKLGFKDLDIKHYFVYSYAKMDKFSTHFFIKDTKKEIGYYDYIMQCGTVLKSHREWCDKMYYELKDNIY